MNIALYIVLRQEFSYRKLNDYITYVRRMRERLAKWRSSRGEQFCSYFRQRSVSIIYCGTNITAVFFHPARHIELLESKRSICNLSYSFVSNRYFSSFLRNCYFFFFDISFLLYGINESFAQMLNNIIYFFYFYANFQVRKYICIFKKRNLKKSFIYLKKN